MTRQEDILARTVLAADELRPEQVLLLPPGATATQIRDAYRKLCLRLHPDKTSSPLATEAFHRIRCASGFMLAS